MENFKNVAPIEDFNWDAYENGGSVTSASHAELEKAYDNTLNKVNDREVIDGTVIAMNKREVVVKMCIRDRLLLGVLLLLFAVPMSAQQPDAKNIFCLLYTSRCV